MSEQEIDNYITLMCSLLRLGSAQREQIGNELRDHLETRVQKLLDAGVERDEAVSTALAEFGDAAGLAIQFLSVVRHNRQRWIMRFATFSTIGMFLVLVLAFAMWPQNARFGGPDRSVAQEDSETSSIPSFNTNPFPPEQSQSLPSSSKFDATVESTSNPGNQPANSTFARLRDRDQEIESALDSIVDLKYSDAEWRNVCFDLANNYGVPIHMLDSGLDFLPDDELVSFQFKQVSVRTALELLLEKHDLTYSVKNGMLLVAEPDSCPLVVRTFDCSKLLQMLPDLPQGGSSSGGGGFSGGHAAAGGGVFAVPSGGGFTQDPQPASSTTLQPPALVSPSSPRVSNEPEFDRHGRAAQIIELVERMVSPDSWMQTPTVMEISASPATCWWFDKRVPSCSRSANCLMTCSSASNPPRIVSARITFAGAS